jgi:hypothetical protein
MYVCVRACMYTVLQMDRWITGREDAVDGWTGLKRNMRQKGIFKTERTIHNNCCHVIPYFPTNKINT